MAIFRDFPTIVIFLRYRQGIPMLLTMTLVPTHRKMLRMRFVEFDGQDADCGKIQG